MKYHHFMRAFEENVVKTVDSDMARLTLLVQQCTGEAREVVESCTYLDPEAGYEEARQELHKRYGDESVIVDLWLQKLMDTNKKTTLRQFADNLVACRRTLARLGALGELNSQRTLRDLVHRLPQHLQTRWAEKSAKQRLKTGARATIDDLIPLVVEAVEQASDPVFGHLLGGKHKKLDDSAQQDKDSRQQKQHIGHAVQEYYGFNSVMEKLECPACHEEHRPEDCSKLKDMTTQERRELVREKRLCFCCMIPGHYIRYCNSSLKCDICQRSHHTLLHDPETRLSQEQRRGKEARGPSESQVQTSQAIQQHTMNSTSHETSKRSRVALPIVEVMARNPNKQKQERARALLDSGSMTTFCSRSLAERLELKGKESVMYINTMTDKSKKVVGREVSFTVADLEKGKEHPLRFVQVVGSLNLDSRCAPTVEDVESWPQLQDVPLTLASPQDVELIIGQDQLDLMVPLETRTGKRGEPRAIKTELGWTVMGRLSKEPESNDSSDHVAQDKTPTLNELPRRPEGDITMRVYYVNVCDMDWSDEESSDAPPQESFAQSAQGLSYYMNSDAQPEEDIINSTQGPGHFGRSYIDGRFSGMSAK